MIKLFIMTKENILKWLIVIGIIAILASLCVQYVKPYLSELSFEKQDQSRIKDIDTLNGIIKGIISTSKNQSIGKINIIYVSLPSDDPTCANLDLPSTPDGWTYHCSNQTDYQKVDGTGWIPINVSGKINQLPIDPVNSGATLNYYAYVTNSTNGYVITGVLNSNKYSKEKARNDGGIDDIRYETGTALNLWGDAEGLIGYWLDNSKRKL